MKGEDGLLNTTETMIDIWSEKSTGLYIDQEGCQKLEKRQQRLKEKVPPTIWKKRQDISKGKRRSLVARFSKESNPARIMNSLGTHAVEPRNWHLGMAFGIAFCC